MAEVPEFTDPGLSYQITEEYKHFKSHTHSGSVCSHTSTTQADRENVNLPRVQVVGNTHNSENQ